MDAETHLVPEIALIQDILEDGERLAHLEETMRLHGDPSPGLAAFVADDIQGLGDDLSLSVENKEIDELLVNYGVGFAAGIKASGPVDRLLGKVKFFSRTPTGIARFFSRRFVAGFIITSVIATLIGNLAETLYKSLAGLFKKTSELKIDSWDAASESEIEVKAIAWRDMKEELVLAEKLDGFLLTVNAGDVKDQRTYEAFRGRLSSALRPYGPIWGIQVDWSKKTPRVKKMRLDSRYTARKATLKELGFTQATYNECLRRNMAVLRKINQTLERVRAGRQSAIRTKGAREIKPEVKKNWKHVKAAQEISLAVYTQLLNQAVRKVSRNVRIMAAIRRPMMKKGGS